VSTGDGYPSEQSVDVALRDGSTVHVRPVRHEDRAAIKAFLESMSAESLYFRKFGIANIEHLTDWSVDVDYADRYGVVATRGAPDSVVGHAAYVRTGEQRAEVAFEVADQLQGQGIATLLLAHLAGMAARHGIAWFTAEVLPSNRRMIDVFRTSGFPMTQRTVDSVVMIDLPTTFSEETLAAFEDRAQTSAIEAVRSFLSPHAVAVVGASRRKGTVGAEILENLLGAGYRGGVYPVNPHAEMISGVNAYRSVGDVPEPVELAVVVVPAAAVVGVARECAAVGVRALLVISAGFAEHGEDGARRQHELLEVSRHAGMRLIGPNCLGVLNLDPKVRLNATFAATQPPSGRIGFLSQSGGLGIALMEAAGRLDLGLSTFVSVGNKADISGNDLLEYWEHDDSTDVILLYLESFGNPRRFARIARRVSQSKPILAVKSGRSPVGARATSSHTGALIAASDVNVDALFRQAGVIRADTIGELLDTAALLSSQPAPHGDRVAIVTNGGGPGILCADTCAARGLAVPQLSGELRSVLDALLSRDATTANPVDMIATATPAQYRRTIELLIDSGECDAIVTLFVPPLMTAAAEVARAVDATAGNARGVTIASVFMVAEQPPRPPAGVPAAARFAFPEDAVRALAHAARWSAWRERPAGIVGSVPEGTIEEAAKITARALAEGRDWLSPAEAGAVLDAYGLPMIQTVTVDTVEEAVAAGAKLGYPVALKAIAAGLIHKTDAGGVELELGSGKAVRAAARAIAGAVEKAGHRLEGFVVQPMASPGVELLAGVVHDASFGPVLVCGAGGTTAELLEDIAVRITPVTNLDAHEMLSSLRSFRLLGGYRGRPPSDLAALGRMLMALSVLVETHPEIAELDLNPVIAGPSGALILDARIRVQAPELPKPVGALRG
jgi:acetyl coenzyme A synthetase (ADP forming)-like protein